MNVTLKFCVLRYQDKSKNIHRKITKLSQIKNNPLSIEKPEIHNNDFKDFKTLERQGFIKKRIPPFMKDIFVSNFNRELLQYPDILNKDEITSLNKRISTLEKIFKDPEKNKEDRKNILKETGMYGAPVCLNKGGFAMNNTESLKYLNVIGSDPHLGLEISNHWTCLNVLSHSLSQENRNSVIDDLVTGESTISLCIREKVCDKLNEADFKTTAIRNSKGEWVINGEKLCLRLSNYLIVICLVEATHFQPFLVNSDAIGIKFEKNVVTFHNSPATQLNGITEVELSKALGLLRLHMATLIRNSLMNTIMLCADSIQSRFLMDNSSSELSPVQSILGQALATAYASESADFFTAGLLDKCIEPDTEIEVAMCRNFIAKHSQDLLVKLLQVPGVENRQECLTLIEDLKMLSSHGDTLHHVDSFIALTGLNYAGKSMADDVMKLRNPLLNPTFYIKRMFANSSQIADKPKLILKLCNHVPPALKPAADSLEYCVLRMKYACELLMTRHGAEVCESHLNLHRLAESSTEILAMSAVLARASSSCSIDVKNSEEEIKLANYFVNNSKERVRQLIVDIHDGEFINEDDFRTKVGRKFIESKIRLIENPTVRVFW